MVSSRILSESSVRPIVVEGQSIRLLDQRKIPDILEYFTIHSLDDMYFAIKEMVVRGAPAIGVAGALGLAQEARRLAASGCGYEHFSDQLIAAKNKLQSSRPTAVNLLWATEKIISLLNTERFSSLELAAEKLFAFAQQMIVDDIEANKQLGSHGATLIGKKANVLTHCNAGALATCGWGTALGVLRSAVAGGAKLKVFVDETRPRQQGARLTTWELMQDQITPTLITDSMAGYLMSRREIDLVIVGADRIAINGDVANKIGTYSVAVLAGAHNIPFYVAAPLSTIDPDTTDGSLIPIEQRDFSEVTTVGGQPICPAGVQVINPAFDVTPARLVTAIITEYGILRPPYETSINQVLSQRRR